MISSALFKGVVMILGPHLSISGGFLSLGKQGLDIGANTAQYFSRNPRGSALKKRDEEDELAFLELAQKNEFGPLLCHAPYTYNLASAKPEVRSFAREAMEIDLQRLLQGAMYNFHPGSHTGQGVEKGIEHIVRALDEIISIFPDVKMTLETMAGKGSEIGSRFEEIAAIRQSLGNPESLGVCIDTCHLWEAGYDIREDLDGVLMNFDEIVGTQYIWAVHLNDSKNPLGARKDRHEKIGQGSLGIDTVRAVITHPLLKDLPFYLETPNDIPGYAREIALLRSIAEV
ncbi:MAG: deoxyribonuclease IV [Tissierellia bacterium]|nr:deoxyribonuclease IV [Tissierellia bacterium]